MADTKRMTESTLDVEGITTSTQKEVEVGQSDRSPTALVPTGGGVLERYISLASAINFGFILQCSWEAVAVTFQLSLLNGGPASLFYGSIFSGLGSTIVATSLAEMSSIDPTVGAQYRWSAHFAPRFNRFWGLMQGWLTVFAWFCALASSFAILANIVVALLIFNYESYNSKRWHATLLMWAFSLSVLIGNFWFRRMLKFLQTIGAICHVIFFLASVITLIVLAERSSPRYVFATLTHDLSGWTNPTVAWGIGLLTVTYSVAGFDGVLHMSDEVIEVRTRVPRSIISSCAMNSVLQFLYIIVLLFTMGNSDKVANSPTGLPLIEVYYEATGSKHATNLFVVMVAIVVFIGTFNIYASVSRLTWAFSRDKGLPFSSFFAVVHPTLKFPLNALGLVGVFQFIIAVIYIGSATAFNAIISMTALALYISYFFPILFFLLKRLSKDPPKFGPFCLGKLGVLVNLVALCYILFIISWMPLPPILPVTGVNMNYAGPIVGAIILFALTDWCFSGRKRFEVPVAHTTRPF